MDLVRKLLESDSKPSKGLLNRYYVMGLNEEPHQLDGDEPYYEDALAAYNRGCDDRDGEEDEEQE